MLSFSNVTTTAFTVISENGSMETITRNFDNATLDGHVYRRNNEEYEVFLNGFLLRTDKICTFVSSQLVSTWNIKHNLNSSVLAHVFDSTGTMIFPKTQVVVDANNIQLTFDSFITGKAIVRTT